MESSSAVLGIPGDDRSELPTHLLEDLAPVLSICDLSKLHRMLEGKGIDVQRYWLELYHQVFQRDTSARWCSYHDPEFSDEDWRQRYLDKTCQQRLQRLEHCKHDDAGQQDIQSQKVLKILENPLSDHCDVDHKHGPLDNYYQSSIGLQSRLLPCIQASEKALQLLQRNLKELVLSNYLPKYDLVLRKILERLIHFGVLRKFTLKHPKGLNAVELFSILEVCAGRRCHDSKEKGDSGEMRKSCKRKRDDGTRSETKHCDSSRGQTEESTKLKRTSCYVLPHDERPGREDDDDGVERQDLYDFCFSEPIDAKSDLCNDAAAVNPHLSTTSDTCLASPLSSPLCDAGSDGDAVTSPLGIPLESRLTGDASQSPRDGPLDASGACVCSACYHQCDSPADHCIQHLVLCGFVLDHPDDSKMLQRVLSVWPGIQELEFIDNLMFGDSCQKTLWALTRGQRHTQSLRRLCIEDNPVGDWNLPVLRHLLLRTKLDKLELKATELDFCIHGRSQGSNDNVHDPCQLGDAFSQLSIVKLSRNHLQSLGSLKRALLLPDCAIRHLDLEHCELNTEMLDWLFISAKDSRCLRELNVGFNHYSPESQYSSSGSRARLSGLVKLIQSGRLTKLDLSGCRFKLQGWTHAKDFVEALRQNHSLRQLILLTNFLTDECLRLLADAFISLSTKTDVQASRLCVDISYNKVTYKGLQTFSRALQDASAVLGCKIKPLRHLTITMEENKRGSEEYVKLVQMIRLTVNKTAEKLTFNRMRIRNLLLEHLSQM